MTAALGLALVGSYLSGSIPFGLLLVRALSGQDVRAVGSGNIGATNVARAAGKKAAVATMILDALKGLVPALLGARYAASLGTPWAGALCGMLAVVGHCFPVWLRFRGGKGVATGFGVALALAPWAAAAGGAIWLLLYKLLHISSVGSLAGVAVAIAVAALTAPATALGGMVAVGVIIVVRHRSNLERLAKHQER